MPRMKMKAKKKRKHACNLSKMVDLASESPDVVGDPVGDEVGEDVLGESVVGDPVNDAVGQDVVGDEGVGDPVGEAVGEDVVGESVIANLQSIVNAIPPKSSHRPDVIVSRSCVAFGSVQSFVE